MSNSTLEKPTNRWERYKILWDISEASPIIRRYFAMNFFDGILTALGIVLASFILFLDGGSVVNGFVFFTGLSTAIAIGISGLTGSHLAESAERKLNVIEMKQVLGLVDQNGKARNVDYDKPKWTEREIRLALGKFEQTPTVSSRRSAKVTSLHLGLTSEQAQKLNLNLDGTPKGQENNNTKPILSLPSTQQEKISHQKKKNKKGKKEKEETIFEAAQEFASRIAAAVDGLSPFAGVLVVIIPFLFKGWNIQVELISFVFSFIFTIVVLFILGRFLARLSKESVLKYGAQMVFAALLTAGITLVLNQLVSNLT